MDRVSLITQVHAAPTMAMLVITGGGTQALADLLAVPGASRTILEALVPYSAKSLGEFLGTPPAQAVSVETAAALAQGAYRRALQLRPSEGVPVVGLACTATLATDRLKKGEHRAHIGVCTKSQTHMYSLTLGKGARDRSGEERIVSDLLLQVLAETCGCPSTAALALLSEDLLTHQTLPAPQ
ncbi:MAG: CinA family protein [Candidatus Binatia bacterium]